MTKPAGHAFDQSSDAFSVAPEIPVSGKLSVRISGTVKVRGARPDKPPALVAIRFRDALTDTAIPATGSGVRHSAQYGSFFYIGEKGQSGTISFDRRIALPEGATHVSATAYRWYAQEVGVADRFDVVGVPSDDETLGTARIAFSTPAAACLLTGILEVSGTHAHKAPALAVLSLRDADGGLLEGPHPGISQSNAYGSFVYLGNPGSDGMTIADTTFPLPPGVASVEAALCPWSATSIGVLEEIALAPGVVPQEHRPPGYLGTIDTPVQGGRSYDITLRTSHDGFSQPRFCFFVPKFLDARGDEIALDDSYSISRIYGSYRYLAPVSGSRPGDRQVQASAIAPVGARHLKALVRSFKLETELDDVVLDVVAVDSRLPVSAEGSIDLPASFSEVILSGVVQVTGDLRPNAGVIDIGFETDAGEAVTVRADGLKSSNRFLNFHMLDLRRTNGTVPFHLSFSPPPQARRLIWRLRHERGMALDMQAGPDLRGQDRPVQTIIAALDAQSVSSDGISADQRDALRAGLHAAPLWKAILRCRVRLLGEATCTTRPGDWCAVSATLDLGDDLPSGTRLAVCPVYFDHDGAEIPFETLTGCTPHAEAGLFRLAGEGPLEAGAVTVNEAFLTPPGEIAFAAFYVLALDYAVDATVAEISSATVLPDAVHADLDTAVMVQDRISQALQIAEQTQDLHARRALAVAHASWAEKDVRAARRADRLTSSLLELDTTWLPRLAPQPAYSPDPRCVLHLFKVIYPDESSGGAVRSTAIAEAQAARGLRPVVAMPLNAPRPDARDSVPVADGIATVTRGGVDVCYPQYAAMNRKTVDPTDLLSLETTLANRLMRDRQVGIIHAASGFRGYENALKGIALAQANDVPLLYEVRSFHEHTWRPVEASQMGQSVTHLRMAQEDRCMAAADAVVTISKAMIGNLIERGVPQDRLFFVPNAIDPMFETMAHPHEILRLRHRHKLSGRRTIGYISNFSQREGHRILLDAFSRLVEAAQDLHLVMVGDGPERAGIAQDAKARGLSDRVVMPGNVDHAQVRAWYHMIDLFVVPRVADFASDYVTPLKPFEAMSQGIPVIMSDRPVTAEIAGAAHERARVFPSGDSVALSALIEAEFADPAALKARAQAARDWVMAERVWSRVVRRYDAAYEMARQVHAGRRQGQPR